MRLNHIDSQFENDPPAWAKLSIAVTVDAPADENDTTKKHHEVPILDVHHYHMSKARSKETKRSMFLRACCGKPQATDKHGRPTTRREHAPRVAAAKSRTPKDIEMIVAEGKDPGFKLDDERFVKRDLTSEGEAKRHGIRPGMYLHAFAPSGKSPIELGGKKLQKFKDVKKLIAKHKDNTPHEYHFRLDRLADAGELSEAARDHYERHGVFVKGYGYAPVHEPVDVINAIRHKLVSSTTTMASKKRKAMYREFLIEALDITTKLQDTSTGVPRGARITDPLRYIGDSEGLAHAIFTELDNPYGKSADLLLDEHHCQPSTLAQILLYWLDRQVHNAAEH